MRASIMTHLVAGFPNNSVAESVGQAMVAAGAAMLEVQLPFSDPTADGPAIQAACQQALNGGFKVDDGFALVAALRGQTDRPIWIMSYANLLFRRGVRQFLSECISAGATGVIAPDLPPETDEGLYGIGKALGLSVLPVVPVSASIPRLRKVIEVSNASAVYTALRAGVTGLETTLSERSAAFLAEARSMDLRILAGFGISSPQQVRELSPQVDTVIVGSALVREIQAALASRIDPAEAVGVATDRLVNALD